MSLKVLYAGGSGEISQACVMYSRRKAAMEATLLGWHAAGILPVTIVRPSHTYRRRFPSAIGNGEWTAERMASGQPAIVHGDGSSLWTLTHARDFARPFARLLGHAGALGEDFHITGTNVHTWNEIFVAMGAHPRRRMAALIPPDTAAGLTLHRA